MRKNIIRFMVICLCLFMLPCTAYAASTADAKEPIEITKDCSMTLSYVHNQTVFPNLKVQVYHIATVSSDFQYTLTADFASTNLTVNGVSSTNEWDAMRTTLESYVIANGLSADYEYRTDSNGSVKLENLTPGLYFIMPIQFANDGAYYYFDSALVALPGLGNDGKWQYDISVKPKPEIDIPTGDDEEYKVVKLWRDNGHQEERPSNIEVDIICNGKVVETVVLSAENNWSYSWTAEDNGDKWQVSERNVPEGYVMTVEEHTTSFTIINTIPGTPDIPQTGDTSNTGLYVMLMCVSGLLLVILGVTAKRKAE